jgi:protein phosphatase
VTASNPPHGATTFGLTDRGRVRETNEDQFLVARLRRAIQVEQASLSQPRALFADQHAQLFIVADGMGGHAGGKEASALAVLTIEDFALNALRFFFRLEGDGILAEFQQAMRAADSRMFEEALRHPELTGMGTTLTMGYLVRDTFYLVHAGDSRCYLMRTGELHQLTTDHTLVGEMVREGAISPAEAARTPFRNVVTNVIGGTHPGVKAEVHKLTLVVGDELLLCSDGLTTMLSDAEITALMRTEPNPERACRRLLEEANERGGRDNITVVVSSYNG